MDLRGRRHDGIPSPGRRRSPSIPVATVERSRGCRQSGRDEWAIRVPSAADARHAAAAAGGARGTGPAVEHAAAAVIRRSTLDALRCARLGGARWDAAHVGLGGVAHLTRSRASAAIDDPTATVARRPAIVAELCARFRAAAREAADVGLKEAADGGATRARRAGPAIQDTPASVAGQSAGEAEVRAGRGAATGAAAYVRPTRATRLTLSRAQAALQAAAASVGGDPAVESLLLTGEGRAPAHVRDSSASTGIGRRTSAAVEHVSAAIVRGAAAIVQLAARLAQTSAGARDGGRRGRGRRGRRGNRSGTPVGAARPADDRHGRLARARECRHERHDDDLPAERSVGHSTIVRSASLGC